MQIIDALNRKLFLQNSPDRIVSLVPSITELLVDLGLSQKIIGVTKFCVFPKFIRETKQIVGGTKKVNYDLIEKLKPNIILCNKEENTKEIVEMLEKRYPVHVNNVQTIPDVLELIKEYGTIFKNIQKADFLVNQILENKRRYEHQSIRSPKFIAAYFIWKEPWMVAGGQTFINEMLTHAGFTNYYESLERYPAITLQTIAPEVKIIFLPSEPFPFKSNHQTDLKQLFPEKKIVLVDGTYFSWHGSRLRNAFSYFESLQDRLITLF